MIRCAIYVIKTSTIDFVLPKNIQRYVHYLCIGVTLCIKTNKKNNKFILNGREGWGEVGGGVELDNIKL